MSSTRYHPSLVQLPTMVSAIESLVNGKFKAKPTGSTFATMDFNEALAPEVLDILRGRVGVASVELLKGKVQVGVLKFQCSAC